MKTKNLILRSIGVLLIMCYLISCSIEPPKGKVVNKRKYKVQLSNWVGSDYYVCDSVIWVTNFHFKLKNNEDIEPFIDIIVPENVVVRIHSNSN